MDLGLEAGGSGEASRGPRRILLGSEEGSEEGPREGSGKRSGKGPRRQGFDADPSRTPLVAVLRAGGLLGGVAASFQVGTAGAAPTSRAAGSADGGTEAAEPRGVAPEPRDAPGARGSGSAASPSSPAAGVGGSGGVSGDVSGRVSEGVSGSKGSPPGVPSNAPVGVARTIPAGSGAVRFPGSSSLISRRFPGGAGRAPAAGNIFISLPIHPHTALRSPGPPSVVITPSAAPGAGPSTVAGNMAGNEFLSRPVHRTNIIRGPQSAVVTSPVAQSATPSTAARGEDEPPSTSPAWMGQSLGEIGDATVLEGQQARAASNSILGNILEDDAEVKREVANDANTAPADPFRQQPRQPPPAEGIEVIELSSDSDDEVAVPRPDPPPRRLSRVERAALAARLAARRAARRSLVASRPPVPMDDVVDLIGDEDGDVGPSRAAAGSGRNAAAVPATLRDSEGNRDDEPRPSSAGVPVSRPPLGGPPARGTAGVARQPPADVAADAAGSGLPFARARTSPPAPLGALGGGARARTVGASGSSLPIGPLSDRPPQRPLPVLQSLGFSETNLAHSPQGKENVANAASEAPSQGSDGPPSQRPGSAPASASGSGLPVSAAAALGGKRGLASVAAEGPELVSGLGLHAATVPAAVAAAAAAPGGKRGLGSVAVGIGAAVVDIDEEEEDDEGHQCKYNVVVSSSGG